MGAILKREIKNYLMRPLFWIGFAIIFLGIFKEVSPYLSTHYVEAGEEIVNDVPDMADSGEVYDGYVPTAEAQRREYWNEGIKSTLVKQYEMTDGEAQGVIDKMSPMDINEACSYLKNEHNYNGAMYSYEDAAYHKGTPEEINSYLDEKLENKSFSFYFSRKFADFASLYMGFFATIMLSVLFFYDTKKHTYELLHTKPVSAGKYVMGKVGAGFSVCLFTVAALTFIFWGLCLAFTRSSGFEVRLWDFLEVAVLYILPNMLMIVCVYTLISLLFKNPLPGVPFLILYMLYSNMGSINAEGSYGYYGRPLAIMVRFPGEFFSTTPPPLALLNQGFLLVASVGIIVISIQLWRRRRI